MRSVVASSGDSSRSPLIANGLVVRAPCDEQDVVAVLREPPADHSADGAGAEDNEAHGEDDNEKRKAKNE